MGAERVLPVKGVTFGEFAALAKRNGWTVDSLAKEFRGGFGGRPGDPDFETARSYFTRVFAGKPSPKSVIVYAPVTVKFVRAKRYTAIGDQVSRCECGCARPVWGRKRTATDACRQRAKRERDREKAQRHAPNGEDRSGNVGAFP